MVYIYNSIQHNADVSPEICQTVVFGTYRPIWNKK